MKRSVLLFVQVLICSFLATSSTLLAQHAHTPQCGTPSPNMAQYEKLLELQAQAVKREVASGRRATGMTNISICPHIIRASDGTGGVTLEEITYMLDRTNPQFRAMGVQFHYVGYTNTTSIYGEPDYIDDDDLYYQYTKAKESRFDGRDVNYAINMYFVNQTAAGENYGGYYPYLNSLELDDIRSTRIIIVGSQPLAYTANSILSHELGHFFSLIHTFEPAYGFELVTRGPGANCSTTGDRLCSTEADPYVNPGATTIRRNGCDVYTGTARDARGDVYTPPMRNQMSYYYSVGCGYVFTAEQYARMNAQLALRNQNHKSYKLFREGGSDNNPVQISISITDKAYPKLQWVKTGQPMGYIVERSLSATSGFESVGAIGPDALSFTDGLVAPNTMYYYRIYASNSFVYNNIRISSIKTPFCRPNFSADCIGEYGLKSVTLGTTALSQNSGCTPGSYSQTTAVTGSIVAGEPTVVSGTFLMGGSLGVAIWADMNRNGEFESTERVYQTPTHVSGSFSGTFSIPNTVPFSPGPLPIRIISSAFSVPNEPCGEYTYGETEDYLVQHLPPAPTNPITIQATHEAATLAWSWPNPQNSADYEVEYRPKGTTQWNYALAIYESPYTLTGLQRLTTYEWRVRTKNSPVASPMASFSTVCPQPVLASNYDPEIAATAATVTWVEVDKNSQYELQWQVQGTSVWSTSTVSGNTSGNIFHTIRNLTTGTVYNWRVRQICTPTISSAFTPIISFTTQCNPPLSRLTSSVYASSANVLWRSLPDNPNYELRWRVNGSGGAWTTQAVPGGNSTIFYTITGLNTNTTYEWQVRSLCGGNNTSAWSASETFFVSCVAPSNLTSAPLSPTSTQLQWNGAVGGTTTYEVRYRPNGSTGAYTTVTNITSTSVALTGLAVNTTFEWGVRILCGGGLSSAFVVGTSFQTADCTPPTVNPNYAKNESYRSADLLWQGGSVGGRYEVRYRPTSTTNWTNLSVEGNPFSSTQLYTLRDLTPNTDYEWQVRRLCSNGTISPYTSTLTFRTYCSQPYNRVVEFISSTSAYVRWEDMQDPLLRYEIQYLPSPNGPLTTISSLTANQTGLYSLTNSTLYEWRVRTVCGPNDASDYASTTTFTTRCTEPKNLSTNNFGATGARLFWYGAADGQTRYEIRYRPSGSTGGYSTVNTISSANFFDASTVVLERLISNTTYEWGVRTMCTDGQSSTYVTGPTFRTDDCPMPTRLYAGLFTSKTASLQWYNSSYAEVPYELQWRPQNTSTWSTTTVGIDVNMYTLTNLTPATTYEWQVKALCGSGYTAMSELRTFETTNICTKPASVTASPITQNSAYITLENYFEFRWRAVGAPEWTIIPSGTTNTISLTDLLSDTRYEYQYRRECSNEWSEYSDLLSFRTLPCLPPTATSIYSIQQTSVSIGASGGSNTEAATIAYRRVGMPVEPGSFDPNSWTIVSCGNINVGCSLTNLDAGTEYEYKVQSVCTAGSSSSYTTPKSFTTETTCARPQSMFADNLTIGSARLYCASSGSNLQYEIRWREKGVLVWTTIPPQTGNFASLTGLNPSTVYEWQALTVCPDNNRSGFSPINSFTTLACGIPANLGTSSLGRNTATLSWQGSGYNNVQYEVQWRLQGSTTAFSSATVGTGGFSQSSFGYSLTGLSENTGYQWQVRQLCTFNSASAFASSSFTTQNSCPLATNRSSSASTNSSSLYWAQSEANALTDLRWRAQGSSTWTVVSSLTQRQYNLTGLNASTTYEWQLRTLCTGGTVSDYTASATFTTLACTVPYLSSTNSQTVSADIYLSLATPATVEFRYRPAGSTSAFTSLTATLTSYSYSLTGLSAGTAYEIQVRRLCDPGMVTAFSDVLTFTTLGSKACTGGNYTIKTGNWTDATIWSCGRVPSSTDTVELRHTVNIPNNVVGQAQKARFIAGGRLIYVGNARLRLGQ